MAMGTITFHYFQVFAFFFPFFFCSHSRKGGAQLVSQRVMTEIVYYYVTPVHNASLSIWPLAFTLLCKYITNTVWNTSDYGDRLAGFRMVLVVNATKAKRFRHHEHLTNACLLHSHFSVFTSAGNATWFTLQNTSRDVISLAAYHAYLTIFL
jgi:hypothetical protein